MRAQLRAIASRTPLWPYWRRFRDTPSGRGAQRRFHRWSDEDDRRLAFYRQFVGPGDLAFDVGANVGNRTKVFARLGAQVVAIDPHPRCAAFLGEMYRNDPRVDVVRAALGATAGQAEMQVCTHPALSSLSPSWIEAVRASGRHRSAVWTHDERVRLETLDGLIERFGSPRFVKIDVEGFEAEVVAGLSEPVPALSMEFHREHLVGARRWLDRLTALAGYRYQLSLGESMEFALPTWVTGDALWDRLRDLPAIAWGDAYARLGQI